MPFEAIEKPIYDKALAVIDRLAVDVLPQPRLVGDGRERVLGAHKRTIETGKKPRQPRRHIERVALLTFELLIIGAPLSFDL